MPFPLDFYKFSIIWYPIKIQSPLFN